MSIELLQSELSALSAGDRRKLMAFMVVLKDRGHSDYAAELACKIADKTPEHWVKPEKCERELGLATIFRE